MRFSRKVFYTKIGWPVWLTLFLTISLIPFSDYHSRSGLMQFATFLVMVEVLIIGLILQTAYKVRANNTLQVTGVFRKGQSFLISDINQVVRLKNKRIAPGFSQNTLAIYYSTNQIVMISPDRPDDFILSLLEINQGIKTDEQRNI